MKVLVLNADHSPLNVTSFQRGFNLVWNGKAEIVEYDKDSPIESSIGTYKRPLVIRLIRYVYIPFKKVPLSRQNIFRRDGHKCGYCESTKDLTLDHIYPKSRGGGNTWKNLVTCCKSCNNKKDNRTPKEAGMDLLVKAYTPTFRQIVDGMTGGNVKAWSAYLS
jgi:5-methylcytosine-specific restriction endonuclease McrA